MKKLSNDSLLLLHLATFERTVISTGQHQSDVHGEAQRKPELTTSQQHQATLLLARIKKVLSQDAMVLQGLALVDRLTEHKRHLEALLPRCQLLELPAEIREQIWVLAVTEWECSPRDLVQLPPVTPGSAEMRTITVLERRAIRIDRFNKPVPPGICFASRQLRQESLHLYFQHNIFEMWRPMYWLPSWVSSTATDWLSSLDERTQWLNDVVFMYKKDDELDHDLEAALAYEGFELRPGVISHRKELNEYELIYEELGLPRHFGKKARSRRPRWIASAGGV